MDNKKRHRKNSGKGTPDMHPTQLQCGEGAGIKPEQLHITDINSGERMLDVNNKEKMCKAESVEQYPSSEIKSENATHDKNSNTSGEIGTDKKQSKQEKKAKSVVNAVLCGMFFIFVIFGMIISVAYMFSENRPIYSEYEKRSLEQFPEFTLSSLSDGSYTKGIDSFFSDNFPLRESLVKSATVLKRFRGIRVFNKDAKQVIHGDTDIYTDGEMEILIDENKFSDAEAIVIPGLHMNLPLSVNGKDENSFGLWKNTENITGVPAFSENVQNHEIEASEPEESKDNEVHEAEAVLSEAVLPEAEKSSSAEKQNTVPLGDKRDTIYILGDTAYEYFRGSTKSSSDYIKVINTYAKYIPENVNIYTLVIPTHPEFGLFGADRTVSNEQKPILEHIESGLDARVIFVNPHAKISEAYSNGEYLYFRTDHHWTIRGAYQAYREFCEKAGIIPVPEENYEKGKIEPFLGTFYSASKREKALAENPDYVEYFAIDIPCTVTRYDKNNNATKGKLYYKSVRGESNGYLAFMGGDFPYIHIKTENANGKKLMIFKESFGNPLIGLLAPHFEEIHVADIRYFKYNSVNFIKQFGITDVLFCNGIMSANSKARVSDLMELMNK